MKKKQWEPETMRAWWDPTAESAYPILPETILLPESEVRILREKDYQRLLKLASKAKRTP